MAGKERAAVTGMHECMKISQQRQAAVMSCVLLCIACCFVLCPLQVSELEAVQQQQQPPAPTPVDPTLFEKLCSTPPLQVTTPAVTLRGQLSSVGNSLDCLAVLCQGTALFVWQDHTMGCGRANPCIHLTLWGSSDSCQCLSITQHNPDPPDSTHTHTHTHTNTHCCLCTSGCRLARPAQLHPAGLPLGGAQAGYACGD
jgi:hypothetical protein